MADLNYFVCTLGQALEVNVSPHPYGTINNFLDHQAKVIPDRLAVGFPVPVTDEQEWHVDLLCMHALYRIRTFH